METLANLLLRPHRAVYDPIHDLGPSQFVLSGVACRRRDVQCSWFKPITHRVKNLPCIVYCHGNCGNRLDSVDVLEHVLVIGATVFAFDFAGSGLSGGLQVTLGYYEQEDIATVVNYLKTQTGVGPIALWGRSMGAAAAILYASSSFSISALVLDSAFATLKQASKELVSSYKIIPSALGDMMLDSIRKHVQRLAGFDMFQICPIDQVGMCRVPAMFIHSRDDQLVSVKHSEALFRAYPQKEKVFIKLGGGHNTARPVAVYQEAADFLRRHLLEPKFLPQNIETLADTVRTQLPTLHPKVRERIRQDLRLTTQGTET